MQLQKSIGLHKLMELQNVLVITFKMMEDNFLGRYDGIATIRCLNAIIYIH